MLSCFGVNFSEITFNGALSVILVDSGMGWLGVAGHPWPPVANYRLVCVTHQAKMVLMYIPYHFSDIFHGLISVSLF